MKVDCPICSHEGKLLNNPGSLMADGFHEGERYWSQSQSGNCAACGVQLTRCDSNLQHFQREWEYTVTEDLELLQEISLQDISTIEARLARYPATLKSFSELLSKREEADQYYRFFNENFGKVGIALSRNGYIVDTYSTGMNL